MLSKLSQSIELTPIRKMFDKSLAYQNTINFTLGQPDFSTPANILRVANQYIDQGETFYTPNAGILPLREAIARKFSKTLFPIDPAKEVMVGAGASSILLLIMQAVLDPGDEVLLPSPYWSSYEVQIQVAGGKPVFIDVHEEDDFELTCEALEQSITAKSKLLILTSPCNPTGAVLSEETLRGIAEIAKKHDLFVITDEVYRYIKYDDAPYFSIASIPGMKERCVVVDSFSKAFAMPGWRVGFAIGTEELISSMCKIFEGSVSCMFAPLQYAAIEALENSQDAVLEMLSIYTRRRKLICEGLNSIDGISCRYPKGAFYVMPNIKEIGISSQEFADRLVGEAGVVTVPGSGLGANGEGYLRMCFATSEENIEKGIERMNKFVRTIR